MKILSKRAAALLLLLIFFLCGLLFFLTSYSKNASAWVRYPANQHLYVNGQLKTGTIRDRNGLILSQTANGKRQYNSDAVIRTAVMHTIGDSGGNVSTGVQTVLSNRLGGWNILNGTYQYASAGENLTLSIDAKLCAAAYEALAGRKGTVGVYNYKTGEILCMVSSPSFDPENPPKIDSKSNNGIYINRFLSAVYTPGSIFKLVTSAAAIDHIPDIGTQNFRCNGKTGIYISGVRLSCPETHGTVDFEQALADSCNIAFGQITMELGSSTLQKYADIAGCNTGLSVDGIKTAAGKVDLSGAKGGNLAWAGIGQYTDTVNPLNFMAYVGAIANGGVRVAPRLLKNSSSASVRILSASTAAKLGEMMRNDVVNHYGDYHYKGLKLCAKTGTAQLSKGEAPHSWFVGFMDRSDCPLAFAVIVENGGAGADAAGPVAGAVLQTAVKYLAGK